MACKPVLDKLPVKTEPEVFGRSDASANQVLVPSVWRAGQLAILSSYASYTEKATGYTDTTKCVVRIDVNTVYSRMHADKIAWMDLWAAAEAINAMCVWSGMEGIATALGGFG